MSSCCGSLCLLALLGVVLAFGNPVPGEGHGPSDSVANLLKLKEPEIGSRPLFSSVIKSINTSCQRKEDIRLMNATLDVYMRIFSSILQHGHPHPHHHGKTMTSSLLEQLSSPHTEEAKDFLVKKQMEMEKLQRHLVQLSLNQDNEDALSKLSKIEVENPIDQRKALAEYQQVYKAASVIASRS